MNPHPVRIDPAIIEAYIAARVKEDGDCLVWTGAVKSGSSYPIGSVCGERILVRRVLWEREHGPLPEGRVVAHVCSTRCCVKHVEAMTQAKLGVIAAKVGRNGGVLRSARIAAAKQAGPSAKLTPEIVAEIRASKEMRKTLAERYGVTPSLVSKVALGKAWREYTTNPWLGLMR